jgi:hypothetical protein
MISCSTKLGPDRHPLAAVPRSDLKLGRKGHRVSEQMAQAEITAESVTDA